MYLTLTLLRPTKLPKINFFCRSVQKHIHTNAKTHRHDRKHHLPAYSGSNVSTRSKLSSNSFKRYSRSSGYSYSRPQKRHHGESVLFKKSWVTYFKLFTTVIVINTRYLGQICFSSQGGFKIEIALQARNPSQPNRWSRISVLQALSSSHKKPPSKNNIYIYIYKYIYKYKC